MNAAGPYRLAEGHVLLRLAPPALIAGVVALLASALLGVAARAEMAQAYLLAFLFWSGIPLGSLAVLMVQHITGGAWGAVIRRTLEAATRTLPLLLLLFLPILLQTGSLYEWAHAEAVADDALLRHKQLYLNAPFFAGRALLYFAVWITLAHFLSRWSWRQDGGDMRVLRRLENLSRGGLLLFTLTMTFASIDWAMSLEPHWYSTIYGVLFIGGQVLSALAFAIWIAASLAEQESLAAVISADRFHDLGKLLLAFIMLWAYFSFSQFLIIWSGNLPEETPWYLHRIRGGWQWVAVAIAVLHFALPFVLLLSRPLKRSRPWLMGVAVLVLATRYADVSWLVAPAFEGRLGTWLWTDALPFLGIGGVWFFFFVHQLRGRPLLPLNDEALPEVAEARA